MQLPQNKIDEYVNYWSGLVNTDDEDYYRKALFAYMSVRTGWQKNVRDFLTAAYLPGALSPLILETGLRKGKTGLYETRVPGIWGFYKHFWSNSKPWHRYNGESDINYRDRLTVWFFGLGITKSSFLIELLAPLTCNVVCLDRHMRKLYQLTAKDNSSQIYTAIEEHWREICKARNVPCAMARHIYWDKIQKQPNTRYWSYCLEPAFWASRAPQLRQILTS